MSFETYNRWHNNLGKQRNYLRAQIEQLNKHTGDAHALLVKNIKRLTDMENVDHSCPGTTKKQD